MTVKGKIYETVPDWPDGQLTFFHITDNEYPAAIAKRVASLRQSQQSCGE